MIDGLTPEQQEDGLLLSDMFQAVDRLHVHWKVKLELSQAILKTILACLEDAPDPASEETGG